MIDKRTKRMIREIFPVRQKLIQGNSIQDVLANIKSNRPDLAERVEAVKELFVTWSAEGVMENGQAFTCSREIFEYFNGQMKVKKQEEFWAILLDNKHKIIEKVLVSKGTLNQSLVHPRDVFAPAIENRAAAIILVHNHPSGDPTPSNQDTDITKRLIETGNVIGIGVLDHVIIGRDKYFSFVDEDLLF